MAAKKCNKKWEDGEIEKLIDLYEENSCLWDIFDKSYQKRDVKEKALAAIAKEFDVQIADIKAKWNAIRRQLGRELDKVKLLVCNFQRKFYIFLFKNTCNIREFKIFWKIFVKHNLFIPDISENRTTHI